MSKKPSTAPLDRHDFDAAYQAATEPIAPVAENELIRQTPWQGISMAMHAMVLLMFWSMVTATSDVEQVVVMPSEVQPQELPDPPKIQPSMYLPEERNERPQDEPTVQPRISTDADSDRNEDPTESDHQDVRPNPVKSDANVESDYPNTKNFNSSIGTGGNLGGGNGPKGGAGGLEKRRARGGPTTKGTPNMLAALNWLRDHQSTDGRWDPAKFDEAGRKHGRTLGDYRNLDGSHDKGWAASEAGVSGLALLAFLGAGFTHQEGEFQMTVRDGLKYLKAIQDNDGCFNTTSRADQHYVYGHAICTMAMAEAYAMTGSNLLSSPAQRGVDFIVAAQNHDPDRGWLGWRYGIAPGDNDTSVTGWMVLALKSAKMASLKIPERCWEGAKRFFDDMTGPNNGYPKTGYTQKASPNARLSERASFVPNESLSAINVLCNLFMDSKARTDATIRGQAGTITSPDGLPTVADPNKVDYYYWYYASLAMWQMGDTYWKAWEKPMMDCVIKSQRLDGEKDSACYGSWDSVDAWGPAGGRVYATAINCLTLQVTYRYDRVGSNRKD